MADSQDTPTFVTHLECSETGKHYPADCLHGLSDAGKPLLVRYDLPALGKAVSKEQLRVRPPEFWRYREFLPLRRAENMVRLGEVMTPLLPAGKLQALLGCGDILIKDEGRLPTGSFKARGLALAVSMAKELGVKRMAMPTNGNAGAALAAYCAAADIETFVVCPQDTPQVNVEEIAYYGAHTFLANGYINDCGKVIGGGKEVMQWFDTSTLKEPYRIEGKKTMGLELAEQLDWQLPDVIFYPTGGGTGLIGMWKAFAELQAIGWLRSQSDRQPSLADGSDARDARDVSGKSLSAKIKLPRMVAVQASGCAPIVRAFESGERHAELWQDAHTAAAGIRVPAAIGDFLILDAVRESGGFAIAVSDEAIADAQQWCAREQGILLCPEGAATLAALRQSLRDGRISKQERSVLFNCATGLKYPMPATPTTLNLNQAIDYAKMAQAT